MTPQQMQPSATPQLPPASQTPTFRAIRLSLLLSLLLFEFHISKVHDGTGQLVNGVLLLWSEAQHVKGIL